MVSHGYLREAQFMNKVLVQSCKIIGGLFGLCLLIGTVWMFVDFQRYQTYHNPDHVPDLSEYLAYYGTPNKMYRVEVDEVKYFGLEAGIGNFAVTISGPPIFLYGEDGQLWDYTLNSGDENFARGGFSMGEIKWIQRIEDPIVMIKQIMAAKK